jgi:hypothetical protein
MRYWVFMQKRYDGPYTLEALMALEGFTSTTPVCVEGELEWMPAARCPSIKRQWAAEPLPIARLAKTPRLSAHDDARVPDGFLSRAIITSGDHVGPAIKNAVSRPPAQEAPSRRRGQPVALPQPALRVRTGLIGILILLAVAAYALRPFLHSGFATWIPTIRAAASQSLERLRPTVDRHATLRRAPIRQNAPVSKRRRSRRSVR